MPVMYNPATRSFERAVLSGETRIPSTHKAYKLVLSRASKSREEAINMNVTGPVYWIKDGELWSAMSRGSWDFEPVTEENQPVHNPGINWGTAYFIRKADADAWAASLKSRHDSPRYEELGDVWGVHYHY